MDFEVVPLLVGLAAGGVLGAGGKGLVKSLAKGYMTLADKAEEWTASIREDFRDAVAEARYEREQEAAMREEMADHDPDQVVSEMELETDPTDIESAVSARRVAPVEERAAARRRSRSGAEAHNTPAAHSRPRATGSGSRSRASGETPARRTTAKTRGAASTDHPRAAAEGGGEGGGSETSGNGA